MRIKINPKISGVLRRLGGKLVNSAEIGGYGLAAHGIGSQLAAQIKAQKLIAGLETDPYWALRLKGAIPFHAKVLTDENDIADRLCEGVEGYDKMNGMQRSAVRRVALEQAKMLSSGRNAAYTGIKNGRPVFVGGKRGMNVGIASHETGHYRADLKRNNGDGSYMKDYARSMFRKRRLSDIFEKNMWKNEDGGMSVPAYEREAWELAPKKWDKETMETALDTYKTDRTGGAETRYGIMTGSGIGLAKLITRMARARRG